MKVVRFLPKLIHPVSRSRLPKCRAFTIHFRRPNLALQAPCRYWLIAWSLAAIFLLSCHTVAFAIDSKYLFERTPKRIALVVGNSKYKYFDHLPGTAVDADQMTALLHSLHFDVVKEVKDVETLQDFQLLYLQPFLDSIEDGSLVLFYFSGHGFTYEDDSYLVPTLFPQLLNSPVWEAAIPARAVLNTISSHGAALAVMILDSCREEFDIKKYVRPQDRDLVNKGFPITSTAANQIISYASDSGKPAIGSTLDKLSLYTASLAAEINVLDREWSDVEREVTYDVRRDTSATQNPWFSQSNTSYIWFNSSPKISKQIQEEWESALKRSTVGAVQHFAEMYAVSTYSAAARQWLAQNERRDVSHFTQVSPVLADAQWSSPQANATQITGPLAIDRAVVVSGPASDRAAAAPQSASVADILVEAGQVVILAKADGRLQPSDDAQIIKTYGFASKLRVIGTDSTNKWLKVSDLDLNIPLFVRIPPTARARPIDLGEPIREIFLQARSPDAPGLIDGDTLRDALSKIENSGWKITWVSIASPGTTDDNQRRLFDARSNNALLILTGAGLPRGIITSVAGLNFSGTQIRVRFFGTRTTTGSTNAKGATNAK